MSAISGLNWWRLRASDSARYPSSSDGLNRWPASSTIRAKTPANSGVQARCLIPPSSRTLLRRTHAAPAAKHVLPVTGKSSAIGGVLGPDPNTAFSSCFQDRGVKPLRQLGRVSRFRGVKLGGTRPQGAFSSTAPTRPEVGFHLSVLADWEWSDLSTEWVRGGPSALWRNRPAAHISPGQGTPPTPSRASSDLRSFCWPAKRSPENL